jgi:hypothetical protein
LFLLSWDNFVPTLSLLLINQHERVVRTKFDILEFVLLVYQLFQKRVVRTKFDILEFVFIGISVIPETRCVH